MNTPLTLLSLAALTAGSLVTANAMAQQATPRNADEPLRLEIRIDATTVEHRVIGSQELYIGAVIVSLSPTLTPYVKGLPPTLTHYALLGARIEKDGRPCVFTSPRMFVPRGLHIYAQGLMLNSQGLEVSELWGYTLDDSNTKAEPFGETNKPVPSDAEKGAPNEQEHETTPAESKDA